MGGAPIDQHKQVLGYCAECDREWGPARREHLGRWLECPENPCHYAAVVRGDTGKHWLRIESWLRTYELKISPVNLLGLKHKAGYWVLIRFVALVFFLIGSSVDSTYLWIPLLCLTGYLLADILIANTSVALFT